MSEYKRSIFKRGVLLWWMRRKQRRYGSPLRRKRLPPWISGMTDVGIYEKEAFTPLAFGMINPGGLINMLKEMNLMKAPPPVSLTEYATKSPVITLMAVKPLAT